jgi:hypothetical protein
MTESDLFLKSYIKERNPERWIPDLINEHLPPLGDSALKGQERSDIYGKLMDGTIRV